MAFALSPSPAVLMAALALLVSPMRRARRAVARESSSSPVLSHSPSMVSMMPASRESATAKRYSEVSFAASRRRPECRRWCSLSGRSSQLLWDTSAAALCHLSISPSFAVPRNLSRASGLRDRLPFPSNGIPYIPLIPSACRLAGRLSTHSIPATSLSSGGMARIMSALMRLNGWWRASSERGTPEDSRPSRKAFMTSVPCSDRR